MVDGEWPTLGIEDRYHRRELEHSSPSNRLVCISAMRRRGQDDKKDPRIDWPTYNLSDFKPRSSIPCRTLVGGAGFLERDHCLRILCRAQMAYLR